MIQAIPLFFLLILSCATFTSEKATATYAESLRAKAESIRTNPNSSIDEKSTADELDRAADLIENQGEDFAKQNETVMDLTKDQGVLKGFYMIAGGLGLLLVAYFGIRFALKAGIL